MISGSQRARIAVVSVCVVVFLAGCGTGGSDAAPRLSSRPIVSKEGIHWHIKLRIFVRGEQITVPANMGIGSQYQSDPGFDSMMEMTGIHTHDDSGTIHWEIMAGPVKRTGIRLAAVFGVWGQPFTSNELLSERTGAGEHVTMTVNGRPNPELGLYEVHDGDEVDIRLGKS